MAESITVKSLQQQFHQLPRVNQNTFALEWFTEIVPALRKEEKKGAISPELLARAQEILEKAEIVPTPKEQTKLREAFELVRLAIEKQ